MSDEQALGQTNLGAQSDQFSLGLVLYELAGGQTRVSPAARLKPRGDYSPRSGTAAG